MLITGQWQALPLLGTLPPYQSYVTLDGAVSFVRKQIGTCLNNHQKCSKAVDTPLPKRLIQFGGEGHSTLRLFEALGLEGRYVTLSHCWGGSQPLKTTTSNLKNMLESIPESELPIVFRQAVAMTQRLGLEYIWID
jgi:hypothetical protein